VKVLIDTNVILDVLLRREPFFDASARILDAAEKGILEGLVGATTVTTVHYLVGRARGGEAATAAIRDILSLCRAAPVDHAVLVTAAEAGSGDFEDAVLYQAARAAEASLVVTRDVAGFPSSPIPVVTLAVLLASLAAGAGTPGR